MATAGERVTFRSLCAVAATLTVVFVAWLQFGFGGERVTTAVDDYGEAAAALVAASACFWAAHRSDAKARTGWSLLGLAALAWGLGELWWAHQEVVRDRDVPFPSVADAGFLAAVPLAALGMLLWPGAFHDVSHRLRAALDGGVIAASLLFVSWALVLGPLWSAPEDRLLATVIALAYPVGDVAILTIVLLVIASADRRMWGPLLLVGAGLSAIAVSDSAFAYFTDKGVYGADLTGVGWFAGWLLVALAALHPAATASTADRMVSDDASESLRAVLLPYVPLVLAAGLLLGRVSAGAGIGPFLAWDLGVVALLVLIRQLIVVLDNRSLAGRLGRAIGELRGREDQLEYQAFHDALTGMANRALFWDRLGHAVARAERDHRPVAVIYLDLDGFKAINDRYGHLVGDMILAGVAERLETCVRPADTLARLGGDEFGVVVEADDGRPPEELGHRLLAALTDPFRVGTEQVAVAASVGMAIGIWSGADQAVAAADAAMYRAKSAGKGRVVVDVSRRAAHALAGGDSAFQNGG
ncbi:MAG: diguanylate cyclase [Actinomycetota bacterium]|jgi:diguanylate cyclase (GGDEF)-like protein